MQSIKAYLSTFFRERKGVVAIEVGLTIGAYLMVIFMIFEMGRVAITHAYLDLVVTEAIRTTKNLDLRGQGVDKRIEALKKGIDDNYRHYIGSSMMGVFAHSAPLNLKVEVNYADTIKDLLTKHSSDSNARLARYEISYNYDFSIPLPFVPDSLKTIFKRQFFVVVQR